MMSDELYGVVRLVLELLLASFLGGVIGFEREMHGEVAGFRTNILICLGACLMMQLSMHMEALFSHFDQNSVVRLDPGRIASYAVAGMGFLGAGAIVKGVGPVRGLTTAAGLWLVTGVGLSVGSGFYVPAVFSILIAMLVLYGLRKLKPRIVKDLRTHISIEVDVSKCDFTDIENILNEYNDTKIDFVSFRRDNIHNTTRYDLRILSKGITNRPKIAMALRDLNGVRDISWTEDMER